MDYTSNSSIKIELSSQTNATCRTVELSVRKYMYNVM